MDLQLVGRFADGAHLLPDGLSRGEFLRVDRHRALASEMGVVPRLLDTHLKANRQVSLFTFDDQVRSDGPQERDGFLTGRVPLPCWASSRLWFEIGAYVAAVSSLDVLDDSLVGVCEGDSDLVWRRSGLRRQASRGAFVNQDAALSIEETRGVSVGHMEIF